MALNGIFHLSHEINLAELPGAYVHRQDEITG